ncbi:hypothetical protein DBR32_12715 [Taibaiella sp. KBW10]|uniref:FkbM family methyltransferase n=1 Tax=Taibaiella sp. KBW10 TaxID=2153357 RepID=UPI000F5B3980|nr:FkbM family methyltransferase [Taibaiella sp. KBW10]RQO30422.1 hypothetical protein DBR32_12715 [Taibaiella sp. KBW10]
MTLHKRIKKLYKSILPEKVLDKIGFIQNKRKYGALQAQLIAYLSAQNAKKMLDADQKEILRNLNTKGLTPFPYDFYYNIINQDVVMHWDKDQRLPYFIFEGKKLYFPTEISAYDAKKLFKSLIGEQAPGSPHCYFNGVHVPKSSDIVLDLGAAEGIFGLSVIDQVKKLILVEGDGMWQKPLQATFAAYKHKVDIINKYVGSGDGDFISITKLYQDYGDISYIKMDIEGAELDMLSQISTLSTSLLHNLTLSVCTYHNQEDAVMIKGKLEEMGFETEFSNGYVFFYYDGNMTKPFLRKVLVKGYRAE